MVDDYPAQPSTETHSTDRSRCLRLRQIVKFISNAAIPLMIGVITLLIAIHQQNIAQTNHDIDGTQAAEVRKQDIEQGRLQREEDQTIARLQRAEDKETVHLQRQVDLQMNNDERLQDNTIAEGQRNLSEFHRTQESQITRKIHEENLLLEDEYRKENILLEYQNDLSTLLLDHESKSNHIRGTWWFVLQMKTSSALRQLDPTRRTILFHTLLEVNLLDIQLPNQEALLYMGNLSGIQSTQSIIDPNFTRYLQINKALIIPRADLRYASFFNGLIGATLSLSYSNLDHSDWSYAMISSVHFLDDMSMNEANFYATEMRGTHFDGYRSMEINFHRTIQMNRVSFEYNRFCTSCVFRRVSLLGIRLNHSKFIQSKFLSLSMADGNFSNGTFLKTIFDGVTLDRVDFSRANLRLCEFIAVSMIDCLMFGVVLNQVSFSSVNLTGCQGLDLMNKQILSQINFHQTILPNGTFIEGKHS